MFELDPVARILKRNYVFYLHECNLYTFEANIFIMEIKQLLFFFFYVALEEFNL